MGLAARPRASFAWGAEGSATDLLRGCAWSGGSAIGINHKLYNAGELKPERVEAFQRLLELSERYRRKNQYE